jgi:hypothetical protein
MNKLLTIALIAAFSAFSAETPKPETAPTITAADREELHEAQEALQADELAATRIEARKKAVEAAGRKLLEKCGPYGLGIDEAGRLQCGTKKK